MKSSLCLVAASALLASAGPLAKRDVETTYVLKVFTKTEYRDVDAFATPSPSSVDSPRVQKTVTLTTTLTSKGSRPTSVPAEEVAPTASTPTRSSAPSQSSGSSGASDYSSMMVEQHNIHRRNHSSTPLAWNKTLAQWADNIARSCKFDHDMNQGTGNYGQNLASWGNSGDIGSRQMETAAEGVTNQWYNGEMGNWATYGGANPPSNLKLADYGHFTQVVWNSTLQVGCATVKCGANTVLSLPSWYTVCNYQPVGNMKDQYGRNVFPPLGQKMATA